MNINREWRKKLISGDAQLYIKPQMKRHSSGFRTFEVGYCTVGDKNRISDKLVLGKFSDHINTDYMCLVGKVSTFGINMDITIDGYIRIWGSSKKICWEFDNPMSTATITVLNEQTLEDDRFKN